MHRIHVRRPVIGAALAIALLLPAAAFADGEGTPLSAGEWSPYGGIGFTLDPDTFLMVMGADYAATDFLSVGPKLQLGVSDRDTIVAPTLNFHFGIDLSDVKNEFVRNIEPYVETGLGLAYIEKDRRSGNRDDTGFLINGGFGAQYWFTHDMAVGSSLLFNGMPDDVAGEHFFVSWQLVTFRYRF